MVEFAILLPVFLMLLCAVIDFGWIFACKNELTNLAGQTARDTAIASAEGMSESDIWTREQKFIADNSNLGNPQIAYLKIDDDTGYANITLEEQTKFLTGFTGIIFGGDNDQLLTVNAAAPVDPYR